MRSYSWSGYTTNRNLGNRNFKTILLRWKLGCIIFLLLSFWQPAFISPVGIFSKHYQYWTIKDEKNWPKWIHWYMQSASWWFTEIYIGRTFSGSLNPCFLFLGAHSYICLLCWHLFQQLSSACLNKFDNTKLYRCVGEFCSSSSQWQNNGDS